MKINKKLPANVNINLANFLKSRKQDNGDLFSIEASDELLFRAIDVDKTSGFYFQIESYKGDDRYIISFKPANRDNNDIYAVTSSAQDLTRYFKIWYDCLEGFAKLEAEFNDPFLNNLEKEFYDNLNLSENEKDKPLSLQQIYLLEEYLTKIIHEIGEYTNASNEIEISEITEEAVELRAHLGKRSTEWVAKKFSLILAKITKEGPQVLRGIFKEAGKQIISQGIKFLLEQAN